MCTCAVRACMNTRSHDIVIMLFISKRIKPSSAPHSTERAYLIQSWCEFSLVSIFRVFFFAFTKQTQCMKCKQFQIVETYLVFVQKKKYQWPKNATHLLLHWQHTRQSNQPANAAMFSTYNFTKSYSLENASFYSLSLSHFLRSAFPICNNRSEKLSEIKLMHRLWYSTIQ